MKTFAAAILTACLATHAFALSPKQLYVSNVPEEPFSWILYTYEDKADFTDPTGPDGKVGIQEVDVVATPLFTTSEKWMTSLGLGYRWSGFEFEGVDFEDLDLHTMTLPIDAIYSLDPWMGWLNVTPALSGDLEHITEDDYHTLLHALGMYQWKPNVQLALGVAYNREFGDDQLYPLGGVVWRMGEEWELSLILPMPKVTYAPSKDLILYAVAQPAGGLWNVEDTVTGSEYDFKVEGFRVGVGVGYEVSPHVWLTLSGGSSIERKYEIGQGDDRQFESDADDTYYVRAGIVLR